MAKLLAKLDDLKAQLETLENAHDDHLRRHLADASAIAERLAGARKGALRRQVDIVEFPRATRGDDLVRVVHLKHRPIESIDSVIQLHRMSTDQAFTDAEGTDAQLVEDRDWIVVSRDLGSIERIGNWFIARPRHLRVVFTAGWADPNDPDEVLDAEENGGGAPPADVQEGVVLQAQQSYLSRRNAGSMDINLPRGGSIQRPGQDVHPKLEQAMDAYRRRM